MIQENKHANVNTADFVYWMWLFSSLAQIACIEIVSRGTIYTCKSFTGTKPAAERPPPQGFHKTPAQCKLSISSVNSAFNAC